MLYPTELHAQHQGWWLRSQDEWLEFAFALMALP